jgi:large subunit ribosomal protein L15
MKQNTLKATPGSKKSKKRIGRGGDFRLYAGRGMNGQNSRSGGGVRPGFEGGQTPLLRRIPKLKGFKNWNKITYFAVNVGRLDELFKDGDTVDAKTLVEKGLLKKEAKLKLLGTGDLKAKLKITVDLASDSAVKKVEKAGGKLTLLKQAKSEAVGPTKKTKEGSEKKES